MANKGIFYYLKTGFKLGLVSLISQAILIIPAMFLMFGSLQVAMMDISGHASAKALFNPIILLLIPVGWTLNGYFVNKFKDWIFK